MEFKTFIFGKTDSRPRTGIKTDFVSNEGKKTTGDPNELLVAASDEFGSISRFISRRCSDRCDFFKRDPEGLEAEDRKLYDAVHSIFRSPVGMKELYGDNGAVSCYVDKNGKIYDMIYIKDTFEELPMGAFTLKQRVFTFIGKTNSTKTTMIEELSIFMMGLINENPYVQIEIANRPGSPVFSVYSDICGRFDENKMPDRSHAGVEIQETSYIVTCSDPDMNSTVSMLLQFKDIPGEDFETLSHESYIMNENRVPIVVISCNDLIEHHKSNSGFTVLDKYLINYAQKAEEKRRARKYDKEQPIIVLSNFDVAAKVIMDERIRKVWERGSSITRTDRLHLMRHRDGLKLSEIRNISHEYIVPFLQEYAPSIYGHLQKIAGGEPLVFACAAAGAEPVRNDDSGCFEYPENFVPFNLDEPILYLMNREGLYPAHEDEELGGQQTGNVLWTVFEALLKQAGNALWTVFEALFKEEYSLLTESTV